LAATASFAGKCVHRTYSKSACLRLRLNKRYGCEQIRKKRHQQTGTLQPSTVKRPLSLSAASLIGQKLVNRKQQKEGTAGSCNSTRADTTRKQLTAHAGGAGADGVAGDGAEGDAPGVLVRREGDRGDLGAVAPFCHERQQESFQEDGRADPGIKG